MSAPRAVGPAALAGGAATAGNLPVTGSPTATLIVAGLALLATGLLLVRASRYRRAER